ncbi:MAG: sensor histidine kinase [Calditrichaeota bacterium]|nr:MAG: sensor histidine kinase [Calditrichota bacterium]MBL1207619.1 sensor histidine kinase [Calditrichota bacterium]NOG47452.1 HAMP domain-containing histidine kinase [Calditrichota bacterium]
MNKANNRLRNITLVIIIIVLFPALFFTAYEINSLNENEEIVEGIYKQQMETLLFAINQYVFSYFESSIQKIDEILIRTKKENLVNEFEKYFSKSNPVTMISIYNLDMQKQLSFSESDINAKPILFNNKLPEHLLQDKAKIQNMIKLKRQGYRKIENFPESLFPEIENDFFVLLYVYINGDDQFLIALLVNNARTFENVIEPKMKEIATDKFDIGIFSKSGKYARFSSGEIPTGVLGVNKKVWIFPEYVFGIRFKGESISQITESRFNQSLMLILFLDLFLLAGGWFIFYNMRKEMHLAQLKSDFVSNVSHELRTPLSLIRMYAETLEMDRVKDEKKRHDYYKNISQESERLTHLINNILNFSRMESGKKEYQFEKIELNELVKEVTDIYKDHALENGFDFSTEYFEENLNITADKTALSEALINLIDNAIKYSPEEKKISIKSGQQNGFAFIEIRDNGSGIEPANHEKVFDKFFRETTGHVHNTKGSGLGLSLVKHIVDAHEGKINLKSIPGKGSTFILNFPINES